MKHRKDFDPVVEGPVMDDVGKSAQATRPDILPDDCKQLGSCRQLVEGGRDLGRELVTKTNSLPVIPILGQDNVLLGLGANDDR
jgi:hypothetical protein